MVVVFVDEFDKLFISSNSNTSIANEITVGVQNEFLKVLESPTACVYGDYGKYVNIDISRTLFVFGIRESEYSVSIKKKSYKIEDIAEYIKEYFGLDKIDEDSVKF